MKISSLAAILRALIPNCRKRPESDTVSDSSKNSLICLDDKNSQILFGTPVILCGSMVKSKPTFNVLANFGVISIDPPNPIIYISSGSTHYTNIGIRENKEFSVCFPNAEIIAKTDYCGSRSGHNVDKSGIFNVQYGMLRYAPLVKECNICFSCKVIQHTKVNDMDVFFAEIVEKFTNKVCFVNGKLDLEKIKPFTFGPGNAYRAIDSTVGIPWSEYKKITR